LSERTLRQIVVHPLKSAPGIPLAESGMTATGLPGDRRWLLVRPDGSGVTLRDRPDLVRLRPSLPPGGGLQLACDDGPPPLAVPVPGPDAERVEIAIKGRSVTALAAGPETDTWFSDLLGEPVRLLHLPAGEEPGGAPLLLTGTASLAALAEHLGRPLAMARFRANLVVDTTAPWEEETWTAVRVGEVVCDVLKPCPRCPMITVDPDSGEREPAILDGLRELRGGRPDFGILLAPRDGGRVRTGDPVVPL